MPHDIVKTHNFIAFDRFQLSVEYIFNIGANGYWTLQGAEVGNDTRLEVVGEKPSAPIGFSYKCSKPLVFRNGSVTLRLNNIQVSWTTINAHLLFRFSFPFVDIGLWFSCVRVVGNRIRSISSSPHSRRQIYLLNDAAGAVNQYSEIRNYRFQFIINIIIIFFARIFNAKVQWINTDFTTE